MTQLDFDDLDKYLLRQDGKIIHQVWFGTIPNKKSAKKAYTSLKLYRDSWPIKNPNWCRIEWDKPMCVRLVEKFYPEHTDMFKKYKYEIQRCDAIRYLILHRYGGWYADMDYFCNRPLDEVHAEYPNDIYLVQTPNGVAIQDDEYVSNSLMYSKHNHPFWKRVLLELEKNQEIPYYYTKHLAVMFSTGPAILNRIYLKAKYKYKVKSLPWKLFHPYGIKDDFRTTNLGSEIFTAHISKGMWSGKDTFFLNTLLRDWKIILFIILILFIPVIFYKLAKQ